MLCCHPLTPASILLETTFSGVAGLFGLTENPASSAMFGFTSSAIRVCTVAGYFFGDQFLKGHLPPLGDALGLALGIFTLMGGMLSIPISHIAGQALGKFATNRIGFKLSSSDTFKLILINHVGLYVFNNAGTLVALITPESNQTAFYNQTGL